jgi:hypothetical protein
MVKFVYAPHAVITVTARLRVFNMGAKLNKGVKLLLERQKTNPDEFSELGRWSALLKEHDVWLEAPERKVIRPRTFNKEVMQRLLTAYDLERKGGAISRAQLLKELLPGLNQLFGQVYAERTKELKDIYDER